MQNIKFTVVKNRNEISKIQDLCRTVFGEDEAKMVEDFYSIAPRRDKNVIFAAFDQEKDICVGTVSLVDVTFRYGDLILKTAEYGVAATDPDYRNLRINTRLSKMMFDTCKERGYNLIVLEGIPYFYRQYGFNYAVPMWKEKLDLGTINFKGTEGVKIRKAESADLEKIYQSYLQAETKVEICKFKEKAIVEAQMGRYHSQNCLKDYYIIEDVTLARSGQVIGYVALNDTLNNLDISDMADDLSFAVYESVVKYLQCELITSKETKYMYASLPEKHKFIRFMQMKGATRVGRYAWQIRILDDFKFFTDILPLLEKRIQNSIYKNENIQFCYNNFKKLIYFTINQGKIVLREEAWQPQWEVNMTPQGAVKLFFGHNSLTEILDFLPDCLVRDDLRGVIEELFPKMDVHFYMNY